MSIVNKTSSRFLTDNNTRYVFLEGLACPDMGSCYASLQAQLSFPEGFGKNLDALDESLADLDWIKEDKIKIVIMNLDHLLSNDKTKKNDFLAVLNAGENKKLELVYLGEGGAGR